MEAAGFTAQHRLLGSIAGSAVCILGVAYAITTMLGLLSLASPLDPIGDPYFTIMELLILPIAPLMLICMVAVHAYAAPSAKAYSLTALVFMILLAGTTSSIHFIIVSIRGELEAAGLAGTELLLGFKWPSIAYVLDIFAWDFFFALSMLFAAPVFRKGKLETTISVLLTMSGVLSLAGLIGVAIANMQVRNIGIIGYAGVAPVAFFLISYLFWHRRDEPDSRAV